MLLLLEQWILVFWLEVSCFHSVKQTLDSVLASCCLQVDCLYLLNLLVGKADVELDPAVKDLLKNVQTNYSLVLPQLKPDDISGSGPPPHMKAGTDWFRTADEVLGSLRKLREDLLQFQEKQANEKPEGELEQDETEEKKSAQRLFKFQVEVQDFLKTSTSPSVGWLSSVYRAEKKPGEEEQKKAGCDVWLYWAGKRLENNLDSKFFQRMGTNERTKVKVLIADCDESYQSCKQVIQKTPVLANLETMFPDLVTYLKAMQCETATELEQVSPPCRTADKGTSELPLLGSKRTFPENRNGWKVNPELLSKLRDSPEIVTELRANKRLREDLLSIYSAGKGPRTNTEKEVELALRRKLRDNDGFRTFMDACLETIGALKGSEFDAEGIILARSKAELLLKPSNTKKYP